MNIFLKKLATFSVAGFCLLTSNAQANKQIFKPGDTGGWHVYLDKQAAGKDPKHVFQFEGDMLHVSGEEFGYISTKKNTAILILHLNLSGDRKSIRQGKKLRGMRGYYTIPIIIVAIKYGRDHLSTKYRKVIAVTSG